MEIMKAYFGCLRSPLCWVFFSEGIRQETSAVRLTVLSYILQMMEIAERIRFGGEGSARITGWNPTRATAGAEPGSGGSQPWEVGSGELHGYY